MNNYPAMTVLTQEQQKIITDTCNVMVNRADSSEHSQNLRVVAQIALAALTRDNEKLAREIVCRLVDVGEADPDVVDSYQVWVLNKLNGVKS